MAALCVRLPQDPFSDYYAEPVIFDSEKRIDSSIDIHSTILRKDAVVTVPIIQVLPAHGEWSPSSADSSVTTSPALQPLRSNKAVEWTAEDLMYLVTCLYPDLSNGSTVYTLPNLADLASLHGHIHLKLYSQSPAVPSRESFSVNHPIGTGRPNTTTLLGQSSPDCTTPVQALRSLATSMLSETPIVSAKIDEYNVLTALFGTPFPDLFSLQRGMVEMSGISEREWNERSVQLGGKVDGESGLEARFEHFLLGIGRQGLEEWLQVVTMAMEMGDKQRVEWAGVYGDASQFLWIAIESVGMEKWW